MTKNDGKARLSGERLVLGRGVIKTDDVRAHAWQELTSRWLPKVFPALRDFNMAVSKGDRGVLYLTLADGVMQRMLSPQGSTEQIVPTWYAVEDFLGMVGGEGGLDAQTVQRWSDNLTKMDPRRDVAFFVTSIPDAEGGFFSAVHRDTRWQHPRSVKACPGAAQFHVIFAS
jgi:hypothetical protein